MKKGLKLWIVLVAIFWFLMIWIKTNNANAASQYTISLSLTSGGKTSDCTWANYSYSTWISIGEQTLTKANSLSCDLYATTTEIVRLQSSNLVNWSVTISSGNLTLSNSATSVSSWFLSSYHKTVTDSALNSQVQVFNKPANKIWQFVQSETIKVKIPAWTPAWTYNGTLTISIAAS